MKELGFGLIAILAYLPVYSMSFPLNAVIFAIEVYALIKLAEKLGISG